MGGGGKVDGTSCEKAVFGKDGYGVYEEYGDCGGSVSGGVFFWAE